MGGVLSSTTEYVASSYGIGLLLFLGVVGAAFGLAYAVVGPGGQTAAMGSYIICGVLLSAAVIYYTKDSQFPSFQYAGIFAMYLPTSYVLVGILSDIVSQRFNESISSIAAIVAILLNAGLSGLATNYFGMTTEKIQRTIAENGDITSLYRRVYEGCTVPGFENVESIFAPQSFVIIWTLFFYFLTMIKTTNTGQSVAGLGGLTGAALLVQIMFLSTNKCLKNEYFAFNTIAMPFIASAVIGLLVGGLFGGLTPNILAAVAGPGAPGAPVGTVATFCPAGQVRVGNICCPPGQVNDRGVCALACPTGSTAVNGVCQVPSSLDSYGSVLPNVGGPTTGSSDDNQFVCEAYKNGELVTSTIAE